MAHLIKLEDYVSRYQYDMYRYPSQFSRLKRERWDRLKIEWENSKIKNKITTEQPVIEEQKSTIINAFSMIKKWYKGEEEEQDNEQDEVDRYRFRYTTLEELKPIFLRELYDFQLNWASSTLREISTLKKQYYYDATLKWLLQSFPDNYFVLYYPTVSYPKAPVQFDILLIGPTDIWCIVNLDGSENTIFHKFSDRYWLEVKAGEERKVVNPFLSLNRMSTIVKRILADTDLDMNVKKVVYTKNGYIDVETPKNVATFLDQRSIYEWNEKMKKNSSPIKSVQLKFSQCLLDVCQTNSRLRNNLEQSDEDLNEIDPEDY
ncbi:NERD domain-containing protein [Anaerobacillus alkaliphilus]|uniref:NERD domain-containing protein n=1 Tax=Anaerobacillus alkaliphilus TaxID=1548597 RepID=A0A4Q0VT68_9BACI|nr:nuclease-related domain-containing protein [Anaerobacillus alkaliphilus]RXI98630.1 NERD domain-containing protein [Anaerobacillus alkaliphilus]